MKISRQLLSVTAFALGVCLSSFAEEKTATPKNGYKVDLELAVNESGGVDDAKVVSSDDTSVDHILELTAMDSVRKLKLPPRMKDGKPVKFTARAPFVFTIDDDEGPEANNAPKPTIRSAVQPVYPADLAAKGEVGGVILELMISAEGDISSIKVLRSSNPEFEQAATAAVKQWVFNAAQKDGGWVESRWRIAVAFETDVLRADWKWRFAPRPSLGSYSVVHRTLPDDPVPAEAPAPPKTEEKPAGK